MAVGYASTTVPAALITVFCLVRVRGPKPLFFFSYRLGLVFDEIPHVVLYALTASTTQALVEGDIATVADWAAVALAAVAAAGLVVVARRGTRTAPVVWRALDEALGAGTATRRRNLLDVHHHRSRPEGGPVLIHFHGGHYDQGRKNTQSRPLLYRLASQGWVCISANYRLRPASSHPDHLIDSKKVIAWAREHATAYGADPAADVCVELPGGQHAFDLFHSFRFEVLIDGIEEFAAWVRVGKRTT